MVWCEAATIDSDTEIVVHLDFLHDNVPEIQDLGFQWLIDTFQISVWDVLEALRLDANDSYLEVLYAAVYETFDGTAWDYLAVDHRENIDAEYPRPIKMPKPGSFDDTTGYIHNLALLATNSWQWPLPRGDLWLPIPKVLGGKLRGEFKKAGRRRRCYDFTTTLPKAQAIIDEINKRSYALEQAIKASQEILRDRLSHILVLEKIRRLVFLEQWAFDAGHEVLLQPTATLTQNLEELDSALAALVRPAIEELGEAVNEHASADDLLAMFDPASDGADLNALLEQQVATPEALPPSTMDDLVDALTVSRRGERPHRA